jgi:hypothetical protein
MCPGSLSSIVETDYVYKEVDIMNSSTILPILNSLVVTIFILVIALLDLTKNSETLDPFDFRGG